MNPHLAALSQDLHELYDFSEALYLGALTRVQNIRCKEHGVFSQYTGALRKGIGCPHCGNAARGVSKSKSAGNFFLRAAATHLGFYTYPPQVFQGMRAHIKATCPAHGDFELQALKHLYAKQGCPECGALKRGIRLTDANVGAMAARTSIAKNRPLFFQRSVEMHKGFYDYSQSDYQGARKKLDILCPKHGVFSQLAGSHMRGVGCMKCSNTKSKEEDRIFQLMTIYTPTLQRDRTLIKPKELDIYMPERQLAIEYCGMYWHSHFTAEDEKRDKKKHMAKYLACKEAGVRLLTIYESEWLEHEYALRRLLRNAAGKSRGKLMARKCELRKVEAPEARAFYNKYHPQGGAGAGEHYALFWKGKIVACMRFVLGANDRGTGAAKRTWTLGRYATRITVAGAASRLFKAFLTEFTPAEVKSFSDNRYFDGGMYTQLGFTLEADVIPDYQVWSPKIGVRPKSHYQRRVLLKRLLEHGIEDSFDPETDPRTEQDMTFLMGAGRIYDCGKKRWVWTAAPKQ